ncbi:receptor-interacting serine/threonine-protein kinase 4 isoform 6 [Anopheles sinensis]|uniref:Receptor-interacting serine/threonine-protein kinase 4 isoform 6 n=1 Tax=Anopheles sinensis TaxID=74873 RepID=A0A084WGZ8_ANOSI|nr:receptor-interacting serine/threonine-protein kinase 4 isoform 6 [Anopheles sinensis]
MVLSEAASSSRPRCGSGLGATYRADVPCQTQRIAIANHILITDRSIAAKRFPRWEKERTQRGPVEGGVASGRW